MSGKLPFTVETDIEWASIDLFGHVNNVAFFFFVQKARLQFCEYLGLTSLNESGKLGFIVASSHCDFIKPLFYPGKIKITVAVEASHNSSFVLVYKIFNQNNEVSAKAKDVLVVFDYAKRTKVTIGEEMRQNLTAHLMF